MVVGFLIDIIKLLYSCPSYVTIGMHVLIDWVPVNGTQRLILISLIRSPCRR
ncbi:hypothetical protein PVAP13_9KG265600 [Panicum virgatum]|uniref:Uncharacterized protein n=1 Tax=Panicum virgatum TaxID=38727 RepID=A0A8T0NH16_PANVG|nr:hypothetical protein PVAP13_9KG265600 [Panicum virgatum]